MTVMSDEQEWVFPYEKHLHEVAPALHEAQNAWMAEIDSLRAPDRKTHELIRMVCTVIARNPEGIVRHAMLAREVGATWDDIVGSLMLTARCSTFTASSDLPASHSAIPQLLNRVAARCVSSRPSAVNLAAACSKVAMASRWRPEPL